MVLAIFIPNISDVIQVLGSLAALFIFIFPGKFFKLIPFTFPGTFTYVKVNSFLIYFHLGMCLMKNSWKKDPNSKLLRTKFLIFIAGLFIIFGTFIFGLAFVQSILLGTSGKAGSKRLCI